MAPPSSSRSLSGGMERKSPFRKIPAVLLRPTIARNAFASFSVFLQERYCFLDSIEQVYVLFVLRTPQLI